MDIEKSIGLLKVFRNYNKFYKEENKNLTITITLETKESIDKAIETLLTAYEKEKGENVKLRLQDIPLIEGELKAYKDRVNELKQELEKEKEKNKEYEILLKRQEELQQEKENLTKQGWLNE